MSAISLDHEMAGWADTRGRLLRSRLVVAGLVLLGLFAVLAFAHPVLEATLWSSRPTVYREDTGFDPTIIHPSGPSAAHPLGTDSVGRDVLSLMTSGLRPTFLVAIAAAVASGLVGMAVGTSAAFLGGRWSGITTRLADAFILLPPPLIFLLASKRGLLGPVELGLLYGLFFGLGPAAIVIRARAQAVVERAFIDAARAAGGSSWWIISRHIVPAVAPHGAVIVLSGVVGALVTQGFVEFLGIGEYRYGLGVLVYDALTYRMALGTGVPWSALITGALSISLLASAFYMLSAGLREVSDPRTVTRRA